MRPQALSLVAPPADHHRQPAFVAGRAAPRAQHPDPRGGELDGERSPSSRWQIWTIVNASSR
jgi:hypothetical protein